MIDSLVKQGLLSEHGFFTTHSGQRPVTADHRQALERFLAGSERRAFRLAHIATGNREDALDIVQDAMCKLVQRYATRSEQEWGPLFYRIVQNRISDWHRRSTLRRRLRVFLGRDEDADQDGLEGLPDSETQDPQRQVQSQQALASLERALHALPLRQQQVFLLRAWEGLDVEQTAAIMGCSPGSVKTHYFRALDKLRQTLGEHWP